MPGKWIIYGNVSIRAAHPRGWQGAPGGGLGGAAAAGLCGRGLSPRRAAEPAPCPRARRAPAAGRAPLPRSLTSPRRSLPLLSPSSASRSATSASRSPCSAAWCTGPSRGTSAISACTRLSPERRLMTTATLPSAAAWSCWRPAVWRTCYKSVSDTTLQRLRLFTNMRLAHPRRINKNLDVCDQ